MESPEGNSKAVAGLVCTALILILAEYAQGICSVLPTADNHPDQTSSEALSWIA